MYGIVEEKSIKSNTCTTIGKVIVYKGPGSRGSSCYYEYSLSVNNIEFNGTYPISCIKDYRGKRFPLVYNCVSPRQNRMLIKPKDFEKFGFDFPDSLQFACIELKLDKCENKYNKK